MDKYNILFLTNNKNSMVLFNYLKERGEDIEIINIPLTLDLVKSISPDLIISYNYKFLIKKDIIEYMKGNVINLHISLLPWNKGVSPNLWSFLDNTPKGVTIHYINEGLDTGDILLQKECFFDEQIESFESTYEKLNNEIVKLFINNWDKIKLKKINLIIQEKEGSYHTKKDLDLLLTKTNLLWNENIAEFKRRIN